MSLEAAGALSIMCSFVENVPIVRRGMFKRVWSIDTRLKKARSLMVNVRAVRARVGEVLKGGSVVNQRWTSVRLAPRRSRMCAAWY